MARNYQRPRGTIDYLGKRALYFSWITSTFEKIASRLSFDLINPPIFENSEIYLRGTGSSSDIVKKELYEVKRLNSNVEYDGEDKKEYKNTFVLRPEFTPGIIRAYLENGLQSKEHTIKLASLGPVFRYDRPQRGRFRQLNQLNLELIGDKSAYGDALIILTAFQLFSSLKIKKDIILDLNTLGSRESRGKIKTTLLQYFENYKSIMCSDCIERLKINPLRVLDCKAKECQEIIDGAPQIIDMVSDEDRSHFQELLEFLDEMGVNYDLNPRLVRGLDYYTRTVFEFRLINDERRQNSLAGGGHYDELIRRLGGRSTPSVGMAIGVERLIDALTERDIEPPILFRTKIVVIQISDKAKKVSFNLINILSKKGYQVSVSLGKHPLSEQLRRADKSNAQIALIIGQKEAFEGSVILRDLSDRSQETVKISKLDKAIKKRINKK